MSLPAANRLNLRLHRQSVTSLGSTQYSKYFTLIRALSSSTNSRFAVLLSRKLSSSSVQRNQIRRLITDIVRRNLTSLPCSIDAIIIPKITILDGNSKTIEFDLLSLFSQSDDVNKKNS